MAITTLDQLIAAFPGQPSHFQKASNAARAAGAYVSLWTVAGKPGAGVKTGALLTGVIPTSATAGAFSFTNPSGAALTYLGRIFAAAGNTGTLILYDRLWHDSAAVANIATLQTITGSTVTRPDGLGTDTELWLEIYTAIGATQTTFTALYTNQSGTGSQSATLTNGVSMPANEMQPFNLAAGDTGVRSVQSVQLGASTLTAGDFGLTILRRIAEIPLAAVSVGSLLDTFSAGMPQIYNSACLSMMLFATGTTVGPVIGSLNLPQG